MRRSDEELAAVGMPGYEDYKVTNAEDESLPDIYHEPNRNTRVKQSEVAPSSTATILRWILFLPAAFGAAFLAQLIASVEQLFFAAWIVDLNIKFFMGAAFVAAGAKVAPTFRLWPAIMLLVIQVGGSLCGIANTWMFGSGKTWWETVLYLAVITGAAVGFFWARSNTEDEGSGIL